MCWSVLAIAVANIDEGDPHNPQPRADANRGPRESL